MYGSWAGQEIMSFSSYRSVHCRSHGEVYLINAVLTRGWTFIGIENSSSKKVPKIWTLYQNYTEDHSRFRTNDFAHKQERSPTSLSWVSRSWRRDFQIHNDCTCCVLCSVITYVQLIGIHRTYQWFKLTNTTQMRTPFHVLRMLSRWFKQICVNGLVYCTMTNISVIPREDLFFFGMGWHRRYGGCFPVESF